MVNTVAIDLDAAADIIVERQWWPGPDRMRDAVDRVCLIMAVGRATRVRLGVTTASTVSVGDRCRADYRLAAQAVADFLGVPMEELTVWNDEQLDGEVVTNALRKCAAELRAQEEA